MLSVATNLSVVSVEVCQLLAWLQLVACTQTANNAMRSDPSQSPCGLSGVTVASTPPLRLHASTMHTKQCNNA